MTAVLELGLWRLPEILQCNVASLHCAFFDEQAC